ELEWEGLPSDHILEFVHPLTVLFHGEAVADAIIKDAFKTSSRHLCFSLVARDSGAFQEYMKTLLREDDVQVVLQINGFKYYPVDQRERPADWDTYVYTEPWKKTLVFKGFQSFRNRIRLQEIKINGSDLDEDGIPYLRAMVAAEVHNDTRMTCTVNFSLEAFYKESRVNRKNIQEVDGCFQPIYPPSEEVKQFISSYLTKGTPLQIQLHVDDISITICHRLYNIPGFAVNTHIHGLNRPIVTHVDAYLSFFPIILRRRVAFRFYLVNPVATPVEFNSFTVHASVKGTPIANVEYSAKKALSVSVCIDGLIKCPKMKKAYLISGLIKTAQLAFDRSATLHLEIKRASIK
ncbi:hypothetical protein WOLCODRAFT_81885, partial [Wolfiporia cocos MD-104 SS10]